MNAGFIAYGGDFELFLSSITARMANTRACSTTSGNAAEKLLHGAVCHPRSHRGRDAIWMPVARRRALALDPGMELKHLIARPQIRAVIDAREVAGFRPWKLPCAVREDQYSTSPYQSTARPIRHLDFLIVVAMASLYRSWPLSEIVFARRCAPASSCRWLRRIDLKNRLAPASIVPSAAKFSNPAVIWPRPVLLSW